MNVQMDNFFKTLSGTCPSTVTRVLYVEDNEEDRQAFAKEVEKSGKISCEMESNVFMGINRIGLEKFDFVLVDYNLKSGDVDRLIDFLRKHEIPFAVISGASPSSQARRRFSHMASFWLTKDKMAEAPDKILETVCL